MAMIAAAIAFWDVVAGVLLGVAVIVGLFILWGWVESKKHARRLREMRRETDEKRQRQ